METLIYFVPLLLFVGIGVFLVIRYLTYRREAEMRESHLNEHLQMMSDGFAKLKEDNPELFSQENSGTVENIRELWGFPPEKENVLKEILIGTEAQEGWDFEFHFPKGVEQYLGSEQYMSLEEKVLAIDGIEACVLNGEVLLLKSSSISIEKLREEVWNTFLAAAFLSQSS